MDKYVDTFGAIQVYGQMVRIELMTVEPSDQEGTGGNLKYKRDGQLIMSLEGFIRSTSGMNQVMNRLVQQGVLKRADLPTAESEVAKEKAKPAKK